MRDQQRTEVIKVQAASLNFSAPSFHLWARHYYKCVQDFQSPDKFSPVPYALLCRAIELELKSRHLENKSLSEVEKFRHNLEKLYERLPGEQKITLTDDEFAILRRANDIYTDRKAFDYIRLEDAATAYKRFPDLAGLDAVAKKLLQRSPKRAGR